MSFRLVLFLISHSVSIGLCFFFQLFVWTFLPFHTIPFFYLSIYVLTFLTVFLAPISWNTLIICLYFSISLILLLNSYCPFSRIYPRSPHFVFSNKMVYFYLTLVSTSRILFVISQVPPAPPSPISPLHLISLFSPRTSPVWNGGSWCWLGYVTPWQQNKDHFVLLLGMVCCIITPEIILRHHDICIKTWAEVPRVLKIKIWDAQVELGESLSFFGVTGLWNLLDLVSLWILISLLGIFLEFGENILFDCIMSTERTVVVAL